MRIKTAFTLGQVGAAAALVGVMLLFGENYQLFINQSDSLPGSVFLVQKRVLPARGDYVVFTPPPNPYHRDLFLKVVGGTEGDVVRERIGVFYVGSQPIGPAKPTSQKGDPLQPGPVGTIGEGQYFVYGTHKDSYDSRYAAIGWIGADRIIGRAIRLL